MKRTQVKQRRASHRRERPIARETTSRYQGVSLFSRIGKFEATIGIDRKKIYLGRWRVERDAAIARDRAVLYFGYEDRLGLNLPRISRTRGAASPERLQDEARRREKQANNSSKYFGVRWIPRRRRWLAYLQIAPHTEVYIAAYADEEAAAWARDRLAHWYFGRTARLNFPHRKAASASLSALRKEARPWKTSRYHGVYKNQRGKWDVQFMGPSGRAIAISGYASEKEAARAYDRAALYYRGPRAALNFPNDADETQPASAAALSAEKRRAFKVGTSSRFRGVSWNERLKRWRSSIKIAQQWVYLGHYADETAAARSYDLKALASFGDEAKPNFHPYTGEELRGERTVADLMDAQTNPIGTSLAIAIDVSRIASTSANVSTVLATVSRSTDRGPRQSSPSMSR